MKPVGKLVVALALVAVGSSCRSPYAPEAVEALDTLAKGDLASAGTLYEEGADVDARFQDGMTALMIMSSSALPESVDMLLRLGADPNLRSDDGSTALMIAAGRGRVEAVRLLIAEGADVHAEDDAGSNALDHAAEAGQRSVVQLLEEAGVTGNS